MISARSLFFVSTLILFIGVTINQHYRDIDDTRTLCHFHIKDTERYLSVNEYSVIYLYSEACNQLMYPPRPIESINVQMAGGSMWSTSSWFSAWRGVPDQYLNVPCVLKRYEGNLRMLFMGEPDYFRGKVSVANGTRHSYTYDILCPDTLRVIRVNKK